MKKTTLTLPEVAMIAGTRGALGAGAALLLADRLNKAQRKTAGWTLLLIGAHHDTQCNNTGADDKR